MFLFVLYRFIFWYICIMKAYVWHGDFVVCEDFSLPVCGLLGSLTSFSFFIRNEIRAMHIVCVVWTGVVSPAKLRMWLTWLNKIRWCGAHYTSCYIQIQERKDEMPHRNIGLELCSSVPILRCIPCVCVCVFVSGFSLLPCAVLLLVFMAPVQDASKGLSGRMTPWMHPGEWRNLTKAMAAADAGLDNSFRCFIQLWSTSFVLLKRLLTWKCFL